MIKNNNPPAHKEREWTVDEAGGLHVSGQPDGVFYIPRSFALKIADAHNAYLVSAGKQEEWTKEKDADGQWHLVCNGRGFAEVGDEFTADCILKQFSGKE